MHALYIFVTTVRVLIIAEQVLMFARAILSWFIVDEESRIGTFLYYATEPVIYPVRLVVSRIPFLNDLPIDISFMLAFLLLYLVQILLPAVV